MRRPAAQALPLPQPSVKGPAAVLLMLALLLVAAAVGGWAVFIGVDHERSLRETKAELGRLTALLQQHAHRTVEASDLILLRLADQLHDVDLGTLRRAPAVHAALLQMAEELPEIGYIHIIDAEGRVVASSLRPEPVGADLSDRPYFRAHQAGPGGMRIGPLMKGRPTGQNIISVSRPLTDDAGAFRGVVIAALATDYFQGFYRSLGLGEDGTAAILRDDGALLVREPMPPAPESIRLPDILGALTPEAPVEMFISVSPFDGVRRVVARRLVPEYGLIVVAGRSVQSALAGWRQRAVQTGLVGLMVILAAGLLLSMGLRSLRRQAAMEDALREARSALERRVEERTASLSAANAELASTVAQRDLLLREVYHRVKNNMQQVDALIALQSRSLRHEEARQVLQDVRLRINALGMVHQRLIESSDLRTFSLRTFLTELCDAIAYSVGARTLGIALTVEADTTSIDIDVAIPLGLLVNELVANAFRHAFPDGRAGTITVRARHEGACLVVGVFDDGIGFDPDTVPATSTGSRIIEALAMQLRATATRPPGPGTARVFTIPLAEEMQDA